jgi:hypothetical protein
VTKKQQDDFRKMYEALDRIAHGYMTPSRIRRDAGGKNSALEYAEYLEMAYDNIQGEAKAALKGVRVPKIEGPNGDQK